MRLQRRQGKSVTVTYAAVASAILVVIASAALVLHPPAPPALAEFAPQAGEGIEEAPAGQGSGFGSGAAPGDCQGECAFDPNAPGGGSAVTTTSTTTVLRPKVRRCVGDPPRQTEDPQSPPCVNFFVGDNGGATSKGVTAHEIRVAFPCGPGCANGTASFVATYQALAEHFNRRYELHGRQIRLIPVQHATDPNPTAQRALAEKVALEVDAFASLSYNFGVATSGLRVYYDELARHQVISVDANSSFRTSDDLRDNRPYQWTFYPTLDSSLENVATMACRSLAGRAAEHAGPVLSGQRRSFAVVHESSPDQQVTVRPLHEGLRRCGLEARVVDLGARNDEAEMSGLAGEGVTTVICLCEGNRMRQTMSSAAFVGYEPEWLLAGVMSQEYYLAFVAMNPEQQRQAEHVFGLGARNRWNGSIAEEPWYWALREIDPSFSQRLGPHNDSDGFGEVYRQLLLLASGIQLAGPRLTPLAFEQGLQRARFPNPGAGTRPLWQARVGFAPGDYSMVDDFALLWWDRAANPGSTYSYGFCFVASGARWSRDGWPEGRRPFFDRTQPCR